MMNHISDDHFTCCICGKEFIGYGNNPWPMNSDKASEKRCCDKCNVEVVIPARIELAKKSSRK